MGGYLILLGLNLGMGASDFNVILGIGVFEGNLVAESWGTVFE